MLISRFFIFCFCFMFYAFVFPIWYFDVEAFLYIFFGLICCLYMFVRLFFAIFSFSLLFSFPLPLFFPICFRFCLSVGFFLVFLFHLSGHRFTNIHMDISYFRSFFISRFFFLLLTSKHMLYPVFQFLFFCVCSIPLSEIT